MLIKLFYFIMIIRVNKETRYSIIDNVPIEDKNLSWGAKGLLAYLLHLPDNWKINIKDLSNRSKNGRDSTASKVNELIKNGYIKRQKLRNKKGIYTGYEYIVYERPKAENPLSDNSNTENPEQLIPNLINSGENLKEKNVNKLNEINTNASFILAYLNEKTGHKYKPTKASLSFIAARLKEGFTVDDCKKVIDTMYQNWKDTEMEKYLTYTTLFRPANFQRYLDMKPVDKDPINGYRKDAQEIITFLNQKAGTNFDINDNMVLQYPGKILKSGRTKAECIRVVDVMVSNWKRDEKFKQNLTPSILFKPGKFQEYLTWKKKKWFKMSDRDQWEWEYE